MSNSQFEDIKIVGVDEDNIECSMELCPVPFKLSERASDEWRTMFDQEWATSTTTRLAYVEAFDRLKMVQ